jgi:hypothetical protein
MFRISRTQENILLASFGLSSLLGLILVVVYSILPSLPHQSRVDLELHRNAAVMEWNTYTTPHYSSSDLAAPCWLSAKFLVDGNGMSTTPTSFTSTVDLPYGRETDNFTVAVELTRPFGERLARSPSINLFISTSNHNDVYFNESTGANVQDWSRTYDPETQSLQVYKRVGDGIKIGGGFLLTVCIVGFLLPIGFFLLRCYEDRHPQSYRDASAEESRLRDREGLAFTPLESEPGVGEDEHWEQSQRRRVDGSNSRMGGEVSRSQVDLEMEEKSSSSRFTNAASARFVDEEIMDERI